MCEYLHVVEQDTNPALPAGKALLLRIIWNTILIQCATIFTEHGCAQLHPLTQKPQNFTELKALQELGAPPATGPSCLSTLSAGPLWEDRVGKPGLQPRLTPRLEPYLLSPPYLPRVGRSHLYPAVGHVGVRAD